MQTVTLNVEGMKCDGCAAAVRAALEAVEGVGDVDVSVADGSARVRMESAVDRARLIETITQAGYRAN
jgi:copper chaperone CopZ